MDAQMFYPARQRVLIKERSAQELSSQHGGQQCQANNPSWERVYFT